MREMASETSQVILNPFIRKSSEIFFTGGQRSQILEILPHLGHYRHFLVFVTGLEGAGKTSLKQQIEQEAAASHNQVISLCADSINLLNEAEFLDLIADSLGVTHSSLPDQLMSHLVAHIQSITERGHRVIFLIDDADILIDSALMNIFEFKQMYFAKHL